jgi:hypothetical protein
MPPVLISLLEASGLALFIWYLFQSLKAQVKGLNELLSTQKKTIDLMSQRIAETEKIGGMYRQLLEDLPGDLERYKKITSTTKDGVIVELQNQYAESQRQLEQARMAIQGSGLGAEKLEKQLNLLKRLLTTHDRQGGRNEGLHLKRILEFKLGAVEKAVAPIENSTSLPELLNAIGLKMQIGADDSVLDNVFRTGALPDGTHLGAGFATSQKGIHGDAWMVVGEKSAWFNDTMFHAVSDELHFVQHTGGGDAAAVSSRGW